MYAKWFRVLHCSPNKDVNTLKSKVEVKTLPQSHCAISMQQTQVNKQSKYVTFQILSLRCILSQTLNNIMKCEVQYKLG